MEFDQLETLLAVLEHGSFTRAAEALGVSQSTVSFQIKGLEATVGNRLLDRSRDGVSATPQGRVLRGYAARIVSLRREALGALDAHRQGLAGHVAVSSSSIPGEYMIPAKLAEFRRDNPGVDVSITVSNSRGALASLLAGDCELAVIGTKARDRKVELFAFGHDEVVLVAAANAPFEPLADQPLRGAPLVLRAEGSGTRDAVSDVIANARADPNHGPVIEVGSSQAVVRCVLAGLGLGFVSRLAAAGELERGTLQEIEMPGLPVAREFFVARLRRATPSAGAAALLGVLCGFSTSA